MKLILIILSLVLLACAPAKKENIAKAQLTYSLSDFYSINELIDAKVDSILSGLDERARIGQMIITVAGATGKPARVVQRLIEEQAVGGVLVLSGEKQQVIDLINSFDRVAESSGALPLIFSSDAEPSLINRKIKGTTIVPKTVDLQTLEACDSIARIISKDLLSMNIRHNFAPVLDISPNNEAITNRTFGNDRKTVIELSSAFIKASQGMEVAATAKHFPGHGLVSGDTHSKLVAIDGEMQEVENYIPVIEQGVISIMVGHIAIVNNEKYQTDGLPASCSRVIVTGLLKQELGYKGIVVTDAMNMGALSQIENASLKAVQAGCDMILMEPDEMALLESIYEQYQSDDVFKAQVNESVKKILRLKVCLNLI